jgi:hypothetical protein
VDAKIIAVTSGWFYKTIFLAELETCNGERLGIVHRSAAVVLSSLMSGLMVPQIRPDVTLPDSTVVKNQYRPPSIQDCLQILIMPGHGSFLFLMERIHACIPADHCVILISNFYCVEVVMCFQFWHSKTVLWDFQHERNFSAVSIYMPLLRWDQLNESSASW